MHLARSVAVTDAGVAQQTMITEEESEEEGQDIHFLDPRRLLERQSLSRRSDFTLCAHTFAGMFSIIFVHAIMHTKFCLFEVFIRSSSEIATLIAAQLL